MTRRTPACLINPTVLCMLAPVSSGWRTQTCDAKTTVSGCSSLTFARTQSLIALQYGRDLWSRSTIGAQLDAVYWATRNAWPLCNWWIPGYKLAACESPHRSSRGPSPGVASVQDEINDCGPWPG